MHNIRTLFMFFIVMFFLCAGIYPFLVTYFGNVLMPNQAQGSLIDKHGNFTTDPNEAIGSVLLGQAFEKPYFLHPRISSINYNTTSSQQQPLNSGSFNYGNSNPALKQRLEKDINNFIQYNPAITRGEIPFDFLSASASGLDPDISVQAALIQIPRIALHSSLTKEQILQIIQENTQKKLWGILGEERVNVLKVNLAIAKLNRIGM